MFRDYLVKSLECLTLLALYTEGVEAIASSLITPSLLSRSLICFLRKSNCTAQFIAYDVFVSNVSQDVELGLVS